ncbi:dihydroorotase [Pseudonocardia kunmingensis]|uniref:Dihydroorotase n=1 Tax=Pseudonocardia kunmingensis TaxID=630975 RepID=A0A543DQM2_9PSEU|nr:dihydroorotase family protein [Pseudonocardia kunmingensis]TQM11608.1 dihydroorotase [Pseudonocardia kunmingensis]
MAIDTVVRAGTVVHDWGREQASVGIDGGRVVGLYAPGAEPEAREVIDAGGCLVLPGAVDMHSHHREGTDEGFEYKEDIVTVTRACAAGGVTTTVAMPNIQPPPNTTERLEALFERYRQRALVDWNVNPAGTVVTEIPGLAAMGVAAFKVFMVVDTGRDYPHMPGIGVHDHGQLMAIMEACAAADVPLMVHPHDQELMDHIEQRFWDRGERDALAYAKAYAAHDGLIWETAIATLLRMQQATGVHLHLLHVQTAGSVELIRQAKARGQKVSAEINPWALFLGNRWENIEKWGSYALSYYVPEKNTGALWAGLGDGTIDIVATDHAPHTRDEKEIGWTDGWKAHTGTPSTQFFLPMLLTAAQEGLISVERVVGATSSVPADLFRLAGKGRIAVGHDADLVVVDPSADHEITDDEVLSKIGWTPYAGVRLTTVPRRTLVRGTTVFADGVVVAEPGHGRQAAAVRTLA